MVDDTKYILVTFTSPTVRESQPSGPCGSKVCSTSIRSSNGGNNKGAPTDRASFTASAN